MKKLLTVVGIFLIISTKASNYINGGFIINNTNGVMISLYSLTDGRNIDDGTLNSNKFDSDSFYNFTHPLYSSIQGAPSLPSAQIQSDFAQTNPSSLDYVKNRPGRTFTAGTSRTLNSSFQISTTNDVLVNYSIDVVSTASIAGGGQDGGIILETSPNNSTWTTIDNAHNQNSVSLAIILNAIQNVTVHVSGMIPSGYWVRIRTVQTTGAPTFSFRMGNETLF